MRTWLASVLVCGRLLAQGPAFDVASFKRHPPGQRHGGFVKQITPTSLTFRNATLGLCIREAYGYENWRVIGPNWRDYPTDVVYEIDARVSAPVPEKQMLAMLQTLLKERLGLEFHREMHELPVYALVVAKGGPKFHPSAADGEPSMKPDGNAVAYKWEHVSMAQFAQMALDPPFTSRHTIDQTGLTGSYDFRLDLEPYVTDAHGKAILDDRGAIDMELGYIQALPAVLGLRLEKKTAPLEVMVIDRVGKDPAGN